MTFDNCLCGTQPTIEHFFETHIEDEHVEAYCAGCYGIEATAHTERELITAWNKEVKRRMEM